MARTGDSNPPRERALTLRCCPTTGGHLLGREPSLSPATLDEPHLVSFFLSFCSPPRQPAGRPDREPTRCPSRAFPGGNRTEGRMWSTGASPHVMSELRASSDSIPVIGAQGTRGAACPERMNRCQDEPQTWALSRVVEARRVSTFTHFTRHPLWASRVCNLEWPPALK